MSDKCSHQPYPALDSPSGYRCLWCQAVVRFASETFTPPGAVAPLPSVPAAVPESSSKRAKPSSKRENVGQKPGKKPKQLCLYDACEFPDFPISQKVYIISSRGRQYYRYHATFGREIKASVHLGALHHQSSAPIVAAVQTAIDRGATISEVLEVIGRMKGAN